MRTILSFALMVGASYLIVWLADGDTMDAVIMYALMDIGTRVRS